MMKCNVCGKRFVPKNEKRYLTTGPTTPVNPFVRGGMTYDTFDCPRCGCQHIIGIRYNEYNPVVETEQEDE